MKGIAKHAVTAAVMILGLAITSGSTTPVPEVARCEICFEGGGGHLFNGNECFDKHNSSCRDCQSFNSCHTNPQIGFCEEYHHLCGLESEEELLALLSVNDVVGIKERLNASNSALTVNRARSAIQVMCGGAVVGHHPISAELVTRLVE